MKSGRGELEFEMVTTRGGDRGESSLYDGSRRRKDDVLFQAMGDVDELSSFLGLLKSPSDATEHSKANGPSRSRLRLPHGRARVGSTRIAVKMVSEISEIQRDLQRVGAMIATPVSSPLYATIRPIDDDDVSRIEQVEHSLLQQTKISGSFVLPGETRLAAFADVARTVCRRAERHIVTCIRDCGLSNLIPCQRYVNRLSDYLFVVARSLS